MLTELIDLPGGAFPMGSNDFYPEESPVHEVTVKPFSIERHPVTNAQFAEFVTATGYVTVAEQALDPAAFPGVPPEDLTAGALVFTPTSGPVDLRAWRQWWTWTPEACWRHPFGPGSSSEDWPDHPVVQVAYPDAVAYADWAGRTLPSEAQWEYAARAGAVSTYAWGDDVAPGGQIMANTWQGRFPYRNDGARGWVGTSPVGTFAPNGFGLVDMIGNVWEWTTTRYSASHHPDRAAPSCCPVPATGDPSAMQVLKGGSHLCAPEYCHRYRPAARSSQSQDSATTHIGFRCIAN
ncbi:formylglycine-generating enzyme family protein [Mycobacterium stomatepiae]|uniref:Sulfatase-modifying factor 1 n=1 Tax=Mycobacterium stomatepiae TaxID=470076 RepID=A0A7I7QC40_9MYCO|nr:formylglycine-generating enzyme family protein [Mycobacterium stomatepiae]MCV7163894.1 formylglycine-generating enzyme family protein [Mycobacterium stomatepiae]BBY23662.1 sulfatase-modifying factor 1 [Mycobacterium stomatepiae]